MLTAPMVRNRFAPVFGLETASDGEIRSPAHNDGWRTGDRMGAWPIFLLSASELVAGRDKAQPDFRASIMKVDDGRGPRVMLSTL
jgi:hypothetical protein